MRIGVIADTHGLLRPEVFDVFKEVDHILHAGDVGKWAVVADLEALARVTAVYGNLDDVELRQKLPQVAALQLDGFDIVVTHGDQFGSPTPAALHAAFPAAEIIVYGHTHRPLLELVDRTVTVMNPGGAGPRRFGLAPSVGIMELEPGIPPRARIVNLGAKGLRG
ncbi:MAG: metallophosphoesterase family protein [Gemmatimonadetes bacterium]|nr:metallophosphoesterase family protein [Gemmatimonadota bacterium]